MYLITYLETIEDKTVTANEFTEYTPEMWLIKTLNGYTGAKIETPRNVVLLNAIPMESNSTIYERKASIQQPITV